MKTRIHVNQHAIKRNQKDRENLEPVITAKNYKANNYCYGVIIRDENGNEVARVNYRPDKPLGCGARVWITADSDNIELVQWTDEEREAGREAASVNV